MIEMDTKEAEKLKECCIPFLEVSASQEDLFKAIMSNSENVKVHALVGVPCSEYLTEEEKEEIQKHIDPIMIILTNGMIRSLKDFVMGSTTTIN